MVSGLTFYKVFSSEIMLVEYCFNAENREMLEYNKFVHKHLVTQWIWIKQ